jgi:hypothetical protein
MDVLVEDALHTSDQQQQPLEKTFRLIKPGGITLLRISFTAMAAIIYIDLRRRRLSPYKISSRAMTAFTSTPPSGIELGQNGRHGRTASIIQITRFMTVTC